MLSLIITLVSHLTYLGIFVGTFIEGPFVGLLAGLLVKVGFLNLFWVYIAHVLGDLSADFFYYFIGYRGQKKFFRLFSIFKERLVEAEKIKHFFYLYPRKIIVLGKLTHALGLPILLGVGISRYPWPKFLIFDFLATIIKSAVLIGLGYYLAEFWIKLNNVISFLGWFGILFTVIIFTYIIFKRAKEHEEVKDINS